MNQEKKFYTILAYTDNSPGVLHRLSTAFTKRKINIESLTVSETSEEGISLFTITAYIPENVVKTIVKQLERIVEARRVYACEDHELLFKEVAMIRLSIKNPEQIQEIESRIEKHNACIVYIDDQSAVIEAFGSEDDTRTVYKLLESYEIIQFARSGRVALQKDFISIHQPKHHEA